MMGGTPGPRVHGPQPGRRGRPRPVRGVRLRRQPPGRGRSGKPAPEPPRTRCPIEEVETPGHDDDRGARRVPRRSPRARTAKAAFFVTGDGRLVTAIVRGDYEVNETKLVNAVKARRRPAAGARSRRSRRAGMEPGYGSPIGARDTVVVVDELVARSPNLVAGANREGFHYRNVNVGARLHAGHRRRHHERPRGRRLPDLRRAGRSCATGSRSATSSSSGRSTPTPLGADVPRRGRRAPPDRHGLVRDRRSGATSPASSRRTTTRRGSSGPTEVAPYAAHLVVDRGEQGPAGRPRSPSALHDARRPPAGREILWDDRDESPGREVHRRRAARACPGS